MAIKHNIYIFITGILFCSCTVNKIPFAKDNYSYGSKLFNTNLEISSTFFGDMKLQNFDSKNIKYIKQLIRHFPILKNKTLIAYLKTNVEPNYETLLFFDYKNATLDAGVIKNDLKKGIVLYKKNIKNKAVYLLLKSTTKMQSKNNATLIADGKTIIDKITFDNLDFDKTTYFDVFNGVKEIDNYLVSRDKLKKTLQKSNDEKFNQFQFLTTVNSFISNNKEYDSLIAKRENKIKERNQSLIDSLLIKCDTVKSVFVKINDLIKDEKVVMLNESHWSPKHRILAFQLLDILKQNEFNYLAIEAIDTKKDSVLNLMKFPSKNTGYYTREPYFGHLLRKAKKLGFQIVAYDYSDNNEDRELAQAINLKKILDNNSKAKLFVYAGIDHILESNPTKKRMAEYFKEISGINPLTFSQDKLIANTKDDLAMFHSSDLKNIPKLNTSVDYFIINNIKPSLKEIYQNQIFRKFNIKIDNYKKHLGEDVLVKVYSLDEYNILKSNAIPILIFMNKINDNKIEFELPKGEFLIKAWSNKDDLLYKNVITY